MIIEKNEQQPKENFAQKFNKFVGKKIENTICFDIDA